jgi:hypothetical protein
MTRTEIAAEIAAWLPEWITTTAENQDDPRVTAGVRSIAMWTTGPRRIVATATGTHSYWAHYALDHLAEHLDLPLETSMIGDLGPGAYELTW